MRVRPFIRLLASAAALWSLGWLFMSKDRPAYGERKYAAIDPDDPASNIHAGPNPVRAAGPAAMRDGHMLDWDKVDQAIDESFPASDPPSV